MTDIPINTVPQSVIPDGIPPFAWEAIGAKADGEGGWLIPERKATGEVNGWQRRFPNQKKGFVAGGHRGLILAWPLNDYAGTSAADPIIIVEGPTDTAALIGVSFDAVGRFSATGGADQLTELLPRRHVCIAGENDEAGRNGARKIAAALLPFCASVRVIFPPEGIKDVRAWILAGGTRDDIKEAVAKAEPLADSFRAPKEMGRAGNEIVPVPITELSETEEPDWHWPGVAVAGHMTLLVGLWKAGKSTFLGWGIRDMLLGGGLVPDPIGGKILVVSEETSTLWRGRRDRIGIPAGVDLVLQPFLRKPSMAQWLSFIDALRDVVRKHGYLVVVFDTLANLWPVKEENNASEVTEALMPLRALTNDGVALILAHHPRKGGGDEGLASRGSGALPSMVDIIIDLTRVNPSEPKDRRRVLKTLSRFSQPPETVIELTDDGYVIVGDCAMADREKRLAQIEVVLPVTGPGLTSEEVRDKWPTKPAPGERTVAKDLKAGFESGRWHRSGTGRRNDALRFTRDPSFVSRTPGVLGTGNESECPVGQANGGGGSP